MPDTRQLPFEYSPSDGTWSRAGRDQVLAAVDRLRKMHSHGLLGGAVMPEDAHPGLLFDSADNYHYFTLCMALNYQRNSYALWRAATVTFRDPDTASVFSPRAVTDMSDDDLRSKLTKHKLALQPISHCRTWRRIGESIVSLLSGDVRTLFRATGGSAREILQFIQQDHPKGFPYLCGRKICNYWLYVMGQYTDAELTDREALSVAPDTHVIQASVKLGLLDPDLERTANAPLLAAQAWRETLNGTGIAPIDIHTPLWLWSRAGFPAISAQSEA